jgi:predicted permease
MAEKETGRTQETLPMRRFLERLLNLLRLRRPDHDLAREIDAHLALLQDTYEARGLSPDAARRAARLALGNAGHVKELHRDARSFRLIEDAWQDAAHGFRLLRRSPVFTATAALSLAIGIGANTAIFTVANALLFRPPAGIANPSELVAIGTARGDGGLNPLGYAAYLEVTRRTTSLSAVFAEDLFPRVMGLAASGTTTAERVLGQTVTSNFFTALGSPPARGRVFADGDESVAILNYDYWRRRFNGEDSVVGRTLRINGRPVTVVGVAAPGFRGTGIQSCDVWLAIGSDGAGSVVAGGRLRADVPIAAAAAEVKTIGDAFDRERGTAIDQARRLNALPFSRAGGNRNIVFGFAGALMVLISLVLAAACANVAGLMLARAAARAREIALRAALGAGRGRLVRQLLTETFVLFLCSGLVGIGLARVLTRLALLVVPALPTSIAVPLTLDWRVLLFAVSLSASAAVVFGVLPAVRGSNVDAGASLKDGARASSGRSRLRSAFVVGQIACSVLLVVLSVSFVRVLRYAGAADPGFDPRGVDVAMLDSTVAGQPKSARAAFWRTVIDRVRQMPAVEAASLARVPPGGWEGIGLGGVAPGDRAGSSEVSSAWNIVDTGYFTTLRIPIVAGRDFAPTDTAGAPPVVVISETLARRLWPGRSAIGKPLRLPPVSASDGRVEQRAAAVIGLAADIRSSSLIDGLADPYVYVPLAQSDAMVAAGMTAQMSIVARRRGGASLVGAMATVLQEIDKRLVLSRTESLADAVALGLTPQRILAAISGAMGLVALLLASMGIYGVTAYSVALRRREFAIRLALGAPPARVIRMVFRQGSWLVAIGLGIGLALAIGAGQVLSVFFYGLPAAHVPTLLGTVALFIAIGAAASVVPAGHAVREGWRGALQED